jgi:hypothetical protein
VLHMARALVRRSRQEGRPLTGGPLRLSELDLPPDMLRGLAQVIRGGQWPADVQPPPGTPEGHLRPFGIDRKPQAQRTEERAT